MADTDYLSVAHFAEIVGVSKQAIYKQIKNKNSRLFPYIIYDGKTPMIKGEAIREVYKKIDADFQTSIICDGKTPIVEGEAIREKYQKVDADFQPESTNEVESIHQPIKANQPISTQESTNCFEKVDAKNNTNQPKIQPLETDYISFLKKQLEEKVKEEKRLNDIIQEKDQVIKDQTQQIALLAQQMAQIATANTKERLLSSFEKKDLIYTDAHQEEAEKKKRNFWSWLFG